MTTSRFALGSVCFPQNGLAPDGSPRDQSWIPQPLPPTGDGAAFGPWTGADADATASISSPANLPSLTEEAVMSEIARCCLLAGVPVFPPAHDTRLTSAGNGPVLVGNPYTPGCGNISAIGPGPLSGFPNAYQQPVVQSMCPGGLPLLPVTSVAHLLHVNGSKQIAA